MSGTTDIQLHWVRTLEDAMSLKRWLGERHENGWLAVDTESAGLDWWRDRLRTVQFGDRHQGWTLEWSEWAGLVKECIGAYDGPIAMHNAKHDVHFLEHNGVQVKRWLVHDTRAMAHLIDPVRRTGLKARAASVLGPWAAYGEQELKQAMAYGGFNWATVPIELEWQYAAFDTVLTAQLAGELWPIIDNGYRSIYELELASTQVLGDMERRGILTDRKYLLEHSAEWMGQANAIQDVLRSEYFIGNAASNQQVIRFLQEQIGWKPIVFTDKGAVSLEREVLQGIGHPAADLVLEYRTAHLLATYVNQHLELAEANGRLHCSINPLGARTGRMSASRPNLQNLPKEDERIRMGFTVDQGMIGLSADYDQIEGRLFAHYSGDRNMLASIVYGDQRAAQGHDGYDMHSMAARMIYKMGLDEPVPKPRRNKAKTGQFSKIYGVGLERFAARNGMTLDEAATFFEVYETEFPETRKVGGLQGRVTERLVERERSGGEAYVMTAYGRKEPCYPSKAYRAVNYLIQGTAADVLKERLVALSKTWLGKYMTLPIHDEVLFEVPAEAKYEAIRVIRETMPERERFAVPLTVGVAEFERWGAKTEIPVAVAA